MLKTIKVKKQMRLDELIKYVWDNRLYPETFESNFNDFAHFDKTGKYKLIEQRALNQATTFTVEVEEEITEDTELVGFQEVFLDKELRELKVEIHAPLKRKSINDVLEEHYEETECLQIYAKVNGKLELIWEAE